jgi:hypothetical protein
MILPIERQGKPLRIGLGTNRPRCRSRMWKSRAGEWARPLWLFGLCRGFLLRCRHQLFAASAKSHVIGFQVHRQQADTTLGGIARALNYIREQMLQDDGIYMPSGLRLADDTDGEYPVAWIEAFLDTIEHAACELDRAGKAVQA